jgi:glyceraldehyde-3-phosphate dehydrogenase (NADP+)
MPFSGRKISATGTLSLYDALRTMSIRVAVATKQNETNVGLFQNVFKSHQSNTLSSDVLISNF